MVVDLLVRLVPEAAAPRFQEERSERLEGIRVASAELPARNVEAAHLVLASRFGLHALPLGQAVAGMSQMRQNGHSFGRIGLVNRRRVDKIAHLPPAPQPAGRQ